MSLPRAMLILLLGVVPVGSLSAQQSSSFKIRAFGVSAIADASTSANFRSLWNASVVTGSAGSCPRGVAISLGFWSIHGRQTVPVVLRASRDASGIVWAWSGQSAEFSLYRSRSPVDLIAPGNLVWTTGFCEQLDSTSGRSDLFFYKVTSFSSANTP